MAQSKRESKRTAQGSFDDANELEKQIDGPANKDDPRWLRRMARRLRTEARKKEKSREHKENQRKRGHTKSGGKDHGNA